MGWKHKFTLFSSSFFRHSFPGLGGLYCSTLTAPRGTSGLSACTVSYGCYVHRLCGYEACNANPLPRPVSVVMHQGWTGFDLKNDYGPKKLQETDYIVFSHSEGGKTEERGSHTAKGHRSNSSLRLKWLNMNKGLKLSSKYTKLIQHVSMIRIQHRKHWDRENRVQMFGEQSLVSFIFCMKFIIISNSHP